MSVHTHHTAHSHGRLVAAWVFSVTVQHIEVDFF